MVIGLEVHAELSTETKISALLPPPGAEPNTQVLSDPGGLPGNAAERNEIAVEYAVKAGLATHCTIAERSREDRKNYFYLDPPKAYQISHG